MTRKAVLVLGMHRSGTSALTGTLVRLGAVGPRTLIGPDAHNAGGYWESVSFNRFHERVLRSAGSSWDAWTGISLTSIDSAEAADFANEFRGLLEQEFGNAPLFVVKDPRICRFVPFWLRNLQALAIEPVAVLTVRPPTEVALSLAARNRLEREQSLLIWLRHMLDAEGETRTIKRSVVRYRDLLEDWKPVVDRITADTGIEWPRRWEVPEAEMADFLKPELCHHSSRPGSIGVDAPLSEWVTRTCEAFDLLLQSHGERKTEAFEALDSVRGQLDRAAMQFGRAPEAERQELRERVAALDLTLTESRELTKGLQVQLDQVGGHAASLEVQRDALQKRTADLEALGRNLRGESSRLQSERDDLRHRAANLEERNENLERELASARHHVDALLGSLSWRFTAPFRVALRILMRQQPGRSERPATTPSKRDS